MGQIRTNFPILLFLFACNFNFGESLETALLFNYKTNVIMNSMNFNQEDTCESCATACPARTSYLPEKQFNDSKSIGKNSLIVQQDFSKSESMKNIQLEICENPFKASVIYNKETKILEFGYELYYGDFPSIVKDSVKLNYKVYGQVTDILPKSFKKSLSINLPRSLSISRSRSQSFSSDEPELDLDGTAMNFSWISLLNLSYNGEVRSPTQISYETNDQSSSDICENYDLGKEIYEDIDLKKMYEQENINKIFKHKVIPIYDEHNPVRNLVPDLIMDTRHVCIKPWNLIPEKYFRFHSPTSFSCSFLTTVPVWCYFADGLLEQLDQYIDALTQIIPGKKLQITSGTLGTLALLPKKKIFSAPLDLLSRITETEPEKPKPPEGMYLAKTKKKIPIPASIYKLVEFKSSICPDDHRQCWYSIIIELRNTPYTLITTAENNICKKSKCFDWGWDLLHREGDTQLDGFLFFCCERTPEIEEKLNLPAHDERKPRYEMNLKTIPYINEKGETGTYINEKGETGIKSLRDEVNQRLLKLDKVESGKSQETDTSEKENELPKLDKVESGKSQEAGTPEKENELLKLSKVESGKSQEADASKKENE